MQPTIKTSFSIREVAARLRTSRGKVHEAIRRRLLVAIDLGNLGIGRHQLRVTPESLAAFEAMAEVKPAAPAKRRRRAEAVDEDVERFLR